MIYFALERGLQMRKRLLIIFLFLVSIIFYLFIYPIQAQADSYKILNMDIQATINENGSVSVIQTINYDFYGSYNGIYITIPFGYTNNLSSDNLDNSLYECSSVHIDSVNVLNNGSKTPFIMLQVQLMEILVFILKILTIPMVLQQLKFIIQFLIRKFFLN